jgi:hypothetical protein
MDFHHVSKLLLGKRLDARMDGISCIVDHDIDLLARRFEFFNDLCIVALFDVKLYPFAPVLLDLSHEFRGSLGVSGTCNHSMTIGQCQLSKSQSNAG